MKKTRIAAIDIAKGIGIILIIIGHCVYFGKFAHNWIFTFHVPLFFILSGLFFRESDLKSISIKKGTQLLRPYLVFVLIGFALTLLIPQWRQKLTLIGILEDIFLAWPETVNVSSVWFLVCLFVTMLMLDIVLLVKRKNPVLSWIIFGAIVLFGFLFGQFCRSFSFISVVRMPLNMDCACVALLFLGAGYFFKKQIFDVIDSAEKHSPLPALAVFILTGALSVFFPLVNKRVNLHGLSYNNWILYILGALNGSVLVLSLSSLISRVSFLKKIFTWFGRNSLIIMGVQAIVVRLFLLFINLRTGNSYQLYYLPEKYIAADCIFSIAASALIVSLYKRIMKSVSSRDSSS